MNLNRIILIGRLIADPEQPTARNQQREEAVSVTKFRIAVSRRGRPREGQAEADFFNVVCFRQSADYAAQYLRKGNLVAVEGALHINDYTDRDGGKQRWIEVQADNVQNLTSREDGGEDRQPDRRDDRRPARDDRRQPARTSREESRRSDFDSDDESGPR